MEASAEAITPEEIRDLLTTLLVEEFDIDSELLTDSATLEDLDLDSLDMVEIGQVVDQRWGARIRASDAEGITNFGGIIEMIHRKLQAEGVESLDEGGQ
jgi:acyl carrier protein